MNYTVTLSPVHMQTVVKALEQVPYAVAAPVLEVIMRQCQEQERVAQQNVAANREQAASEQRWADMEGRVMGIDAHNAGHDRVTGAAA
jgi:hypothetical protein